MLKRDREGDRVGPRVVLEAPGRLDPERGQFLLDRRVEIARLIDRTARSARDVDVGAIRARPHGQPGPLALLERDIALGREVDAVGPIFSVQTLCISRANFAKSGLAACQLASSLGATGLSSPSGSSAGRSTSRPAGRRHRKRGRHRRVRLDQQRPDLNRDQRKCCASVSITVR